MEIRYPLLIVPFIVVFFVVIFIKFKSNKKNKNKVANTQFVKNTSLYKSVINKYKTLIYVLFGILFISVLGCSLLTSRFVSTSTHTNQVYDRDIMLCLDVSGSMYETDQALIDSYGKLIDEMHGERFGMVIFNSSSITLLPLTEDYDYAKDVVKKASEAFSAMEGPYDPEKFKISDYIYNGTTEGQGASIVGDGFATCVLGFPKLDNERSRIIILATDNDVNGPQIITVPEAGELAKKYKITVYPVDNYGNEKTAKELKEVAEKTGGKYYLDKTGDYIDDIVKEIEKKEKSLRETTPITTTIDHPTIPLIMIVISLLGLLIMERVIKR